MDFVYPFSCPTKVYGIETGEYTDATRKDYYAQRIQSRLL